MDWDSVFGLASRAAMLGWVVLIFAPRSLPWISVVPRLVIPLGLSVLYSALMLAYFVLSGGGFGSIAEVRTLFASDPVLVGGWVHFLAYDLLVGCYVAQRLDRVGVSRIIQGPVLIVAFLFGPMGLLLGLVTEGIARWRKPAALAAGV